MTTQERFAADWKMDVDRVHKLVRLAKECGKLNERVCNGDPHPRIFDKADKNANAARWSQDLDESTAELERFAQQYGFASVAYTGLFPTLMRDGQYVEVPY